MNPATTHHVDIDGHRVRLTNLDKVLSRQPASDMSARYRMRSS